MAGTLPGVPAHKQIPGTGFIVDGFRCTPLGAKAWFLTHAHSDHYTGLSESWSTGPIYCSEVTARLVTRICGVDPRFIHPLTMGETHTVHGTEVVLVDANHCPGAVQLLFRVPLPPAPAPPRPGAAGGSAGAQPSHRTYIHTGDFRFDPSMLSCPHLAAWRGCDALYLDTTYCNPKHTFPPQEESVDYVVRTINAIMRGEHPQHQEQEHVEEGQEEEGRGQQQRQQQRQQQLQDVEQEPQELREHQEQEQGRGREHGREQGAQEAVAHVGQGAGQPATAADVAAAGGATAAGSHAAEGAFPFPRLFLVSTYVIGKERILLAIRQRCGLRVYVPEPKLALLACQGLPPDALADTFTTDPRATPVHVVGWGVLGDTWPYFRPNFVAMQRTAEELGVAGEVVGFCPTGWVYEMRRNAFPVRTRESLSVHLVPYSEHSSYSELREYVKWLKPKQVVPTVGVEGEDGERKRAAMLKQFRNLVDETASKARFLQGLLGQQQGAARAGGGAAGAAGSKGSQVARATSLPAGAGAVGTGSDAAVQERKALCEEEAGGGGEGTGAGRLLGRRSEGGGPGRWRPGAGKGGRGQKVGVGQQQPQQQQRLGAVGAAAGGTEVEVIVLDSSSSDDDGGAAAGGGGGKAACAVRRCASEPMANSAAAGARPALPAPAPAAAAANASNGAAGCSSGRLSGPSGHVPVAAAAASDAGDGAAERSDVGMGEAGGSQQMLAPAPHAAAEAGGAHEADQGGLTLPGGPSGQQQRALPHRQSQPLSQPLSQQDQEGEDAGNDGTGVGGDEGAGVGQLLAVLGGAVGRAEAAQLLAAARNDVAAALNLFFDKGAGAAGRGAGGGGTGGRAAAAAGGSGGVNDDGGGVGRSSKVSGAVGAKGAKIGKGNKAAGGSAARAGGGAGSGGGSGRSPAAKRQRVGPGPGGGQGSGGGAGGAASGQPPQRSIMAFMRPVRGVGGGGEVPQEGGRVSGGGAGGTGGAAGDGSGGADAGPQELARVKEEGKGAAGGEVEDWDVRSGPHAVGASGQVGAGLRLGEDTSEAEGMHLDCTAQRPIASNATVHTVAVANARSPLASSRPKEALLQRTDRPQLLRPRRGAAAAASAHTPSLAAAAAPSAAAAAADPQPRLTAESVQPLCGAKGMDVVSAAATKSGQTVSGGSGQLAQQQQTDFGDAGASPSNKRRRLLLPQYHPPAPMVSTSPAASTNTTGDAAAARLPSPAPSQSPSLITTDNDTTDTAHDPRGVHGQPSPDAPSSAPHPPRAGNRGTHVPPTTAKPTPTQAPQPLQQLAVQPKPEPTQGSGPGPPPHAPAAVHPFFRKRGAPAASSRPPTSRPLDSAAPAPVTHPSTSAAHTQPKPTDSDAHADQDGADHNPRPAPPAAAAVAAGAAPTPTGGWEHARGAVLLPVERYDPQRHACWGPVGAPTPYLHVALCLAAMDSTTKRLAIRDALTNMFRSVLALCPGDLVAVLYLLTGRIAPEYDKAELSVGGATVAGALQALTGAGAARLRQLYKEHGDLGDVAQACRRTQSTLMVPQPLLVGRLLQQLRAVAADKGPGVAARRQGVVLALLRAARDVEVKYLTRTLIANLRVGANWRSVLGPLGRAVLIHQRQQQAVNTHAAAAGSAAPAPAAPAAGGPPPPAPLSSLVTKAELEAADAAVTEAYHVCPNFEVLVPALVEGGLEGLRSRCGLTPGVPLKPMLAKICEGVADGLRQLGPGAPLLAEYKYDGVRAQIHLLPDGRVYIFSRNCEDRTDSYPDVCAVVREAARGSKGGTARRPVAGTAAEAGVGTAGASAAAAKVQQLAGQGEEDRVAGGGGMGAEGQDQPEAEVGAACGAAAGAQGVAGGQGSFCGGDGDGGGSGLGPGCGSESCVLDAEVVAVEWLGGQQEGAEGGLGAGEGGGPPYRLRSFQELATRARGQVEEHEVSVEVCVFVFDLLYWNGRPLLHLPLRARRSLLPHALPGLTPGRIMLATAVELQPLSTQLQTHNTTASLAVVPGAKPRQQQGRDGIAAGRGAQGGRGRGRGAGAAKVGRGAGRSSGVGGGEEGGAKEAEGDLAALPVRQLPAPGEPGGVCVGLGELLQLVGCGVPGAEVPGGESGGSDEERKERRKGEGDAAIERRGGRGRGRGSGGKRSGGREKEEGDVVLLDMEGEGEEGAEEEEGATGTGAANDAAAAASLVGVASPGSCAEGNGAGGVPQPTAEDAVMELLVQSFNAGAEGLMLKRLDGSAAYEPSRRSEAWIKIKRDYCEGLRDSVDVVPIGAWHGQGRKVKWFSPFLLAVWDPVAEEFQSLCRCMSGFTDEFYAEAKERLSKTIIPGPKPYYNTGERPSVWFEPTEVWELRGADLTVSPVHCAAVGRVHPQRGLGMRFPRFIRLRPDKRPEDATTPEQLAALFHKQTRKATAVAGVGVVAQREQQQQQRGRCVAEGGGGDD